MMVMIQCEGCGGLWIGDPDEDRCPYCDSDELDWAMPDPEDVPS